MKTLLITAAVLMTGASVYGIVDYRQKSGKKEFHNLYTGSPAVKTTAAVKTMQLPKIKEATTTEVKKTKPMLVKKMGKKRQPKLRLKQFSRARPAG